MKISGTMDERSKIGSTDNELTIDFRIYGSFATDADINVSPGSHNESNIEFNDISFGLYFLCPCA